MNDLNKIFNIDTSLLPKTFKKGDVLQVAGAACKDAFFVKKGLLKSYTIDEKGKEHIFLFAPENWVIAEVESFEVNQKAILYIECIEDSEILVLNRDSLLASNYTLEQYKQMTDLLFRRIGVLQRRLIMMMSATAQERYESFLERYPELPNRVPQKMIASYLGITPEALSKIRGKMAREK